MNFVEVRGVARDVARAGFWFYIGWMTCLVMGLFGNKGGLATSLPVEVGGSDE